MKIIYEKGKNLHKKKFILGRTTKQRWHLIRILATQLMEQERIRTTAAKAKHLKPTVERLLKDARKAVKDNRPNLEHRVNTILTTDLARNKLWNEIVPRLLNFNSELTNVQKLEKRRKGDNTEMGYIEILGKLFKKPNSKL